MCLTINIPFKNFQLIIGPNRKNTVVERYIFDNWTDEGRKKRFHGSVTFFEAEAMAGRTEPSLFKSAVHRIHVVSPETNSGTTTGSLLEVNYDTSVHDAAFFEDFFHHSGIAVHRAEPFRKPIISLGGLVKRLFYYDHRS